MKTQNLEYKPDLDVLRALAAITVFFWHFVHFKNLVPMATVAPGLAIFEEGHVGVSLFMVLSGYLFTIICYKKEINWSQFYWNRLIRIAPLLVTTQIIWLFIAPYGGIKYDFVDILKGVIFPIWPGGAWSIAVEIHFYALIPFIMILLHGRDRRAIALFILVVVLNVTFPFEPSTSYHTIFGRLSQFVAGLVLAIYLPKIPKTIGLAIFCIFIFYLEYFNIGGGHQSYMAGNNINVSPSFPRFVAEGVGFAGLMIWALNSEWKIKQSRVWLHFAWIGRVSYSVYLLHIFLLIAWFAMLDRLQVSDAIKLLSIIPCFGVLLIASAVSYRFIESPFLRKRVRYIKPQTPTA